MPFSGFGPGVRQFFFELGLNNTKEWFEANRSRYETEIREPAEAYILELGGRLAREYPSVLYDTRRNGGGSLLRIHRDVRFAKDKRPYKENLGIVFALSQGKKVEQPIFYFHIDMDSAFFYGGRHVFPPDTLERYRRAVDDPKTGTALVSILESLERLELRNMEDPQYKRVPRPWTADHPRADLLRQGALGVGINLSPEEFGRRDLVDRCAEAAVSMRPLVDWLLAL